MPRLLSSVLVVLAAFAVPARAQQDRPALRAFDESLTPQERQEFIRLRNVFADHVGVRLSQGWNHSDLGNAYIATVNALKFSAVGNVGEMEGFNIPRLACEERIESLRAERDRTRAAYKSAAVGPEKARAKAAKEFAAEKFHKCQAELRRTMGTCQDWAIDVCYVLRSRGHMSAFEDGQTTWNNGTFQHAACRVRLKRNAQQSVVFDAWMNGRPDVYAAADWPRLGQVVEFQDIATEP